MKAEESENYCPDLPIKKNIHSPVMLNQDVHKQFYNSQVNSPTRNRMSGVHSLSNGGKNSANNHKRSDTTWVKP